ncbi:MAG: DUF3256 family protein [Prevotella sp.]|nr:DUF3256 family protein [Prevotella sp.]
MKKFLTIVMLGCLPVIAPAQVPVMATVFKQMPDSLMPYLSKNNRLDMLDFMDAKMKAEVTNLLDGRSEMTAITDDSLSIRLSDALRVDMKLERVEQPVDSGYYVVRLVRTYIINANQTERIADVYSSVWRKLSSCLEDSSLLRRDEEVFDEPHF